MTFIIVVLIIMVCVLWSKLVDERDKNENLKNQVFALKKTLKKYEENNDLISSRELLEKNNTISRDELLEESKTISSDELLEKGETIPNIENVIKEFTSSQNIVEEPLHTQQNIDKIVPLLQERKEEVVINHEEKVVTHDEKVKEERYDKQTIKNTSILITGAILIVLSAIVFLLSTWNTTPSIVKTSVLVLLIGVFLGASNIAEKKFNLIQTSKTFYYIAMAYIPIVLFSISIFKLFGEFFSISGAGKFIYLAISSIFVALLYHIESIKKSSIIMMLSSIVFQIMSVVFMCLIIRVDFYVVLLGLLLYSIVINVLIKSVPLKMFLNEYKIFAILLFYSLYIMTFISTLYDWVLVKCTVIQVINLTLSIFNFLLLSKDSEKSVEFLNINILSVVMTLISFESIRFSLDAKALIMSSSVMIVYFVNYLASGKFVHKSISYFSMNFVFLFALRLLQMPEYIRYITFVTTLIVIAFEKLKEDEYGKYYIIASFVVTFLSLNTEITLFNFIMLVVTSLIFIMYRNANKFIEMYDFIPLLSLMPSIFLSSIFKVDTLRGIDLAVIVSLALIALITIKSMMKEEPGTYTVLSVMYIIASLIAFNMNIYVKVIIVLIWAILHAFAHKTNDIYKAIAYISGLIIYNMLIADLKFNSVTLIELFGYITCVFLMTRTILKQREMPYEEIEGIAIGIIYVYGIIISSGFINILLMLIFTILTSVWGYNSKANLLYGVSLIASSVLYHRIIVTLGIDFITLIKILGYIICTFLITRTILKEKEIPYEGIESGLMSIIYTYGIITSSGAFDILILLVFAIAMSIWGYRANTKAMYAVSLVASSILYNKLIIELGLGSITLIKLLGYLICTYLLTRTVVKPADGPYEGLEGLAMTIMYAYGIVSYTGSLDALTLLIFMLLTIVYGFQSKSKVLYAISLIASSVLLHRLLFDIQYHEATLVVLICYLSVVYLISRTVLKSSGYSYKELEYIGTGIIYTYALFTYTGMIDAMIFIGFMLALVILSYSKKIGPLFLMSLIAIVINAFKLTKDFWFSIPWWLYMCMVGVALLTFAVRNEISENQNKENWKDTLKAFKDKIDM